MQTKHLTLALDIHKLSLSAVLDHQAAIGDVKGLPIARLAQCCKQETSDFFRGRGAGGNYGFEMFRRAVVEKNDAAWNFIDEFYQPVVLGWLKRGNRLAQTDEEPASVVNEVFCKFHRAVSAEKFASFANLSAVLSYLRTCADSVILDHLRKVQRVELDLEPNLAGEDSDIGEDLLWEELLELIMARLKDDDERLIFRAMFVYGMKPSEICSEWPERFPTVQPVNQKRQNMMDRLKRDEFLLRYYRGA